MSGPAPGEPGYSLFRQPRAVWAVAFASVVAFMGIGLVDPILPTLATELDASRSDVSLLFTSYFLMTGVAMLVSGWFSSRFGAKRTLLTGLALVVAFSALAGAAGGVGEIVGFRLGWGLGNALFISTALAVIVGAASGGLAGAIVLYEAALGLGIASGPLLGGLLGSVSWRGPFFGTAALMAVGFVLVSVLLEKSPKPDPAERVSLSAPLRALSHPGLRGMALVAALYNFGFFTLLGYAPFPLGIDTLGLGFVFFGWGLLLAMTSVFAAQRIEIRFGLFRSMRVALAAFGLVLVGMAVFVESPPVMVGLIVVSGGLLGIINTVMTQGVMAAADVARPIASSAYSFVRFTGGAVAPFVAGKLGEAFSDAVPFAVGGAMVFGSVIALNVYRHHVEGRDEDGDVEPAATARREPRRGGEVAVDHG